eukprot:CAMPEP_0117664546 /NCGR_PEP_ID=MMETSP0804-20121206/9286_1 /TAXON_ID=1074897 /ORGANISM="Tetraselmis astigmatica, Strain CCMP880" /LENGTH=163 /DNA_ID=CAMNT_0005471803 /DNA_START=258 /DNA_END=751 /DNA_ORIENTATION=-
MRDPTAQEIFDSVTRDLKLQAELEANKCYSRDFWVVGRVRVKLKNDDGTLVKPDIPNRKVLMEMVAERVAKITGRSKRVQAQVQAQQKSQASGSGGGGGGGGKSGKKKKKGKVKPPHEAGIRFHFAAGLFDHGLKRGSWFWRATMAVLIRQSNAVNTAAPAVP